MKIKNPLQSKEIKENEVKTKFAFASFVLLLAFVFFTFNFMKVSAAGTTEEVNISGTKTNVNVVIDGTKYEKVAGEGKSELLGAVELIGNSDADGAYPLTFIQSNGNGKEVDIYFTIKNFPSNATAFMIVESEFTDSSLNPDADRYSKESSFVQVNNGVYLKVGELYYEIKVGENTYSDNACQTLATEVADANYINYRGSKCAQIVEESRYNKTGAIAWVGSTTNSETGKIEIDENGNVKVVYTLRTAGFGMKYFKIVFYEAEISDVSPTDNMDIHFVVSKPIDTIDLSHTNGVVGGVSACKSQSDVICVEYTNGAKTRESQELKLYIPSYVAFEFKTVSYENALKDQNENGILDYLETSGSTIYAINYFTENADGTTTTDPAKKDEAAATYLYTNFEKGSCSTTNASIGINCDSKDVTNWLVDKQAAKYGNHIGLDANTLEEITMKVDASGAYYFYITDIFGNVTNEIYQEVTNVGNRAIETVVTKGNAIKDDDEFPVKGYNAEETFTNESVMVTLNMQVRTNYEFGQCLNAKCTSDTLLSEDNIKLIKYWRVDVELDDLGYDKDAYEDNDPMDEDHNRTTGDQDPYASESWAATDSMNYILCNTSKGCVLPTGVSVQSFVTGNEKATDGSGFGVYSQAPFLSDGSFRMMIGLSGRYRFYIEDVNGNNTWGSEGDLTIKEYRNPRVEVYAIDKAAPEITFDHSEEERGLTKFDIETYEYYRGIDETNTNANGYVHNARSAKNTSAEEKTITTKIYYEVNRDTKDDADKDFTNADAIKLSKVIVEDKLKGYSASDDKTYATFKGVDSSYVSGSATNDITTIKSNIMNNSTGLKVVDSEFAFEKIEYLHNDATSGVCTRISDIVGEDQLRCVNYYLDHGVDFIIKFTAQDALGNESSNMVYVNVVDTTPGGFTYDEDAPIRATNIISDNVSCRMEVGQTIGYEKTQNVDTILNCYNVSYNGMSGYEYRVEDNVYAGVTDATGLRFENRINSKNYIDLYIYDDNGNKVDLKEDTFTPNSTGYYDLDIVLNDGNGNVLTVQVSYYVDKKIVLIAPIANEKLYGQDDVQLHYCVYIDKDNHSNIRFSNDPYSDMSIFTPVYCTKTGEMYEGVEISTDEGEVLGGNKATSSFTGALSRIESSWYNGVLNRMTSYEDGAGKTVEVGVENNYVGNYNIVLGTTNITVDCDEGTCSKDNNYIIKIHKDYRTDYLYQTKGGTLVTDANKETAGNNSIYGSEGNQTLVDDDSFAQSKVLFTIKQVVLEVKANGGSKNYAAQDTNSNAYNNDSAANKYLGGYSVVTGLKNDGKQYGDTSGVVLGVLRRATGEDVGVYAICNYRGNHDSDTAADARNMYVGCDEATPGDGIDLSDASTYEYENGIIKLDASYVKTRALYVATNKKNLSGGKSMNGVESSVTRDNAHANYVIKYTGDVYQINPIDLIVQAAPGQRREYNASTAYSTDPNPWEIILYGLQENYEKLEGSFNGFTATANTYDVKIATLNVCGNITDIDDAATEVCYQALLATNQSERRDTWYYMHDDVQLTGLKTNDTYKLLRSTDNGSEAGSGVLVREDGKNGGWYDYYSLANDVNVGSTASANGSKLAVVTNNNEHCSYDTTGHAVTVVGTTTGAKNCKNYNLIYNAYYTDEEGYRKDNKKVGASDDDYIYKSTGINSEFTCMNLDADLPCYNSTIDGDDTDKKYRITFEIYRREIILEFNSGIETIKIKSDEGEDFYIVYGQRYNFYNDKFFDMTYYYGEDTELDKTNGITPENYLFYCYQNMSWVSSGYDPGNPEGSGCTGNPRYGLTDGDSWKNIGLTFKLNDLVKNNYSEGSRAIPAGVYFVFADIATEQKTNYNFKYQGGTLTIKSKPVDINIASFTKEYGEANYSGYGYDSDYASFALFGECVYADGEILSGGDLIAVECMNANNVVGEVNRYAFTITGLDESDLIADNFYGRPMRSKSTAGEDDSNGLQDNVGTYPITKGSIISKLANPYITGTTACARSADPASTCVVVSGETIQNYLTNGETREYTLDRVGDDHDKKTIYHTAEPAERVDGYTYIKTNEVTSVANGNLYITPAVLTITVTSGQTKMYGCAYNGPLLAGVNIYEYSYANGYTNCVELDGDYYDLGYEFTVAGDKDYQIALENTYTYSNMQTYTMTGNNRPSRADDSEAGIKAHALNDNGVLYRVIQSDGNIEAMIANEFGNSAKAVAASTGTKKYQGQAVGTYIITLGSLNVPQNEEKASYNNKCDENNNPSVDGDAPCRNYNIDYYDADLAIYDGTETNPFPSDLLFTITGRRLYLYTDYDSKIYGDEDPVVEYTCLASDVTSRLCGTEGEEIEFGLTKYYAKTNSMAVAPWNEFTDKNGNEKTVSDYQTAVVTGKISRKGMGDESPKKDDVKGLYEYRYSDKGGTVALTSDYGIKNYLLSDDNAGGKYNESGLAVNSSGNVEKTVTEDGRDKTYKIQFEIILRKIEIMFISFNKVYGESDVATDYDILVCAPAATAGDSPFVFENGAWKCSENLDTKHGLSSSHESEYLSGGILDQDSFKEDFKVRFKRVLGENVSCGTSTSIAIELNGNFYGAGSNDDGTKFNITISCKTQTIGGEGKSVYETLAYIDQGNSELPGYNYQVSYKTGYVNITPRPLVITPLSGQGFVYGDYHDTLIPSIKFTDSVKEGSDTIAPYGLVNGGDDGAICLKNIDYYNNGDGAGTCFYINDRQNVYSENSHKTFEYTNPTVNSNTGIAATGEVNYVFGDVYTNETDARKALNRTLGIDEDARYNRNVGEYTITLGTLVNSDTGLDTTGNYKAELATGTYKYVITAADLTVTPQSDQSKVYGEIDVELKFDVLTEYTVAKTYYAKYTENIVEVCKDAVCRTLSSLTRYEYNSSATKESEEYYSASEGAYIKLTEGEVVKLKGFAYGENRGDSQLNYGANKNGEKTETETVSQSAITDTSLKYYDRNCRGVTNSSEFICNATAITYTKSTNRILLGYLYVENHAQNAATHNILNGIGVDVANNEFAQKNYGLTVVANVKFTIIPRPVGIDVVDITKTYGQTTDAQSCDVAAGCTVNTGILTGDNNESLMKYNFNIVDLNGKGINDILGDNLNLYDDDPSAAVDVINGLAGALSGTEYYYTVSGNADTKNSQALGVYVSRDEGVSCMYDGDKFGFCEDVGVYPLRIYGYANTIDAMDANYASYRPTATLSSEATVSEYYYDSYFGYNPNYFVVLIDGEGKAIANPMETETQTSTARTHATEKLLAATGKLTINQKDVKIYVNTHIFDSGSQEEIYYIEQNSNPPELPTINNDFNLKYEDFATDRSGAVYGGTSYTHAIWGRQNSQVRTKDKLTGNLAYCNVILSEAQFVNNLLEPGITSDYSCSELLYNGDREDLNTNLTGYIPIVRDSAKMSITNEYGTIVDNGKYEKLNYTVTFYPGALRVEIDDTKPVVNVNRSDVYIEANAVGTYSYECVGENGTTTYTAAGCEGSSIVGSYDQNDEETILRFLKTNGRNKDSNQVALIMDALPKIDSCGNSESYECTASSFLQLAYGKGKADFRSNGGITPGEETTHVLPFTKQVADNEVDNTTPHTSKELINALVNWFGVTAYDLGEIRNGVPLNKVFDKYWIVIIESNGVDSEGNDAAFEINRVGSYRVHFYVMDNAGNVSQGNMNTDAYYEIRESNRYNLNNGNYVQNATGNYLKVSSYLQMIRTGESINLYSKDNNGTYVKDADGIYLLHNGKYYDINDYKRYAKMEGTDDYILNADGSYIELHASYYKLDETKVYDKNDGTGSQTAIANGRYLKVSDDYNNVGTLHIIDTTKPTVGTLNLYNGKVSCKAGDCSVEDNWKVANDTYLPVNTLLKYNADGSVYSSGQVYVEIGSLDGKLKLLSSLTKYKYVEGVYVEIEEDEVVAGAQYILIPAGNKAIALKHYTWSNASLGIFLTITGGADNSYTDSAANSGLTATTWSNDISQWDHYYSRDGGNTWFAYSRTASEGMLALAMEGKREIMIKAVDKGVKLTSDVEDINYEIEKEYFTLFYGAGNEFNRTAKKTVYNFTDSSADNAFLYGLETIQVSDITDEIINKRYNIVTSDNFGWNVSEDAEVDADKTQIIANLIFGTETESDAKTAYKYYRDRQYAYYDITKPKVSIGGSNGEKLYLFEYGCETLNSCKNGYDEKFATVSDTLGGSNLDNRNSDDSIELSTSILLDKLLQGTASQYEAITEGIYTILVSETLATEQSHSGLSSDEYSMSGEGGSKNISSIHVNDRIYVIYEYRDGDTREDHDLSSTMTNNVIPSTIEAFETKYCTNDANGEQVCNDVTYTVVYSVIDKAGNESVYIARGVIFANLVPNIEITQNASDVVEQMVQVEPNTYKLNVEQGTDVNEIINSMSLDATIKSNYITQTVYYNGELVAENKRYNPNIYEGFTTDNPGVYEIVYNLDYKYYNSEGESEMISAKPLKLVINVEATNPVVETQTTNSINYQNIILLISLLTGAIFVAMLGIFGKKRI